MIDVIITILAGIAMFGPMIFFLLTDQKRANKKRVREMLFEIKNDPEKLSAIKALLNRGNPTEVGALRLLLLEGEMIFTTWGMAVSSRFPSMIDNGKLSPYWSKIFQQMEENGWNIKKLKI